MYKIRKKLFLFLAVVFSVLLIAASSVSFLFAGAAGANDSVPTIDGNLEEYKDCFSVDGAGVLTKFSLPEDVKGLYSVKIPKDVAQIGSNVFKDEFIESVTIPSSVTEIGEGAFSDCRLLSSVVIEDGNDGYLTISANAFAGCLSLRKLEIPKRCTTIETNAFSGCALRWVTLNSALCLDTENSFENATVVFSNKSDYDAAVSEKNISFKEATFVVSVKFYVGGEEFRTVKKLYNKNYSFEYVEGVWHDNPAITDLPVQDESYSSTVWYDKEFKNKIKFANVNDMLSEGKAEIELYAHETVVLPEIDSNIKAYGKEDYSLKNSEQMAQLLGISENVKVDALVFTAYAVDSKEGLESLNGVGDYLVFVSLNPEYGEWKSNPRLNLVLTHDDARTMQLMLITLAILGLLAVVLSISLVLVRVGVAKKKKRRDMTSEEVIDKFIAAGGRTRLKK